MDVWVLLLTFTVRLLDTDIMVHHSEWLFPSLAVCEAVRPVLIAKAQALQPPGFTTTLTPKVTECMVQRVVSREEALDFLGSLPDQKE